MLAGAIWIVSLMGELANDRVSSWKLMQCAAEQGMMSLRQDGWRKVLRGSTSVEEVVRAAAEHAASVHGHEDSPEMRKQIEEFLETEESYQPGMREPEAAAPSA